MAVRYTRRADSTGWLIVKLTRSGQRVALCEYTKVTVLRDSGGRTYFTIDDGWQSPGEEASLTTANAGRYLVATGPVGAAMMTATYEGAPSFEDSPFKGRLKQQWAKLTFGGETVTVTLNSVWNGSYTPLPPGLHAILTPDNSHANIPTAGYAAATPGMVGNDVWFPIGLSGSLVNSSRYVHVGHLSEGCVTVHQLEKWSTVYQYLISHRVQGSAGKRIGTLRVKK